MLTLLPLLALLYGGILINVSGEKCEWWQTKCPSGVCVNSTSECDTRSGCARNQKRCPNGICIGKYKICRVECTFLAKECIDGTCVDRLRDDCPENCSYPQNLCDEVCIDSSDHCPGSCAAVGLHECDDQSECFTSTQKCDGFSDCMDGSDEFSCKVKNMSRIIGIVAIVVLLLLGVLFISIRFLLRNKKRNRNAERQRQLSLTGSDTSYESREFYRRQTPIRSIDPAEEQAVFNITPNSVIDNPFLQNSSTSTSYPTPQEGAAPTELPEEPPPSYETAIAESRGRNRYHVEH